MPYEHSYPFCWRCDTPLIYYARNSWFVKMTAVREQLLANWDRFVEEKGAAMENYVNPFWRPRGLAEADLPAPKRLAVSAEWAGEDQVVGRKWRQHQAAQQSKQRGA